MYFNIVLIWPAEIFEDKESGGLEELWRYAEQQSETVSDGHCRQVDGRRRSSKSTSGHDEQRQDVACDAD